MRDAAHACIVAKHVSGLNRTPIAQLLMLLCCIPGHM